MSRHKLINIRNSFTGSAAASSNARRLISPFALVGLLIIVSAISLSTPSLVKSMGEAPIISNLTVASGRPYEIVDFIGVNDLVYIDRVYTFTSLPVDIDGARYIRTANDDKTSTLSEFLTFSVDQDSTVFVAYDTRASSLPNWMSDWTEFGGIAGTSDIDMKLYFKNFGAGTVSLGGNMATGSSGAGSNYSVFVTGNGGVVVTDPPVNEQPTASFSASVTSGDAPLNVNFDASLSDDPDGSIVSYEWDFGDGQFGAGQTASHVYDFAGTYSAILTVTDDFGDSVTAQTTITVNEPPVASGVTLAVQSGSVQTGNSIDIPVILSEVPVDIAGFEFTFSLSDAARARITGVTFANFGLVRHQMVSDSEVFMTAIDINGVFQINDQNVQIGTVRVEGILEGTASMSLGGIDVQDMGGINIPSDSTSGTLTVTAPASNFPTLPGASGPSQDLDGDGLAEDVNGNGGLDFADIVMLFNNMETSLVQQSAIAYDFNGNGRVDMADLISLFEVFTP